MYSRTLFGDADTLHVQGISEVQSSCCWPRRKARARMELESVVSILPAQEIGEAPTLSQNEVGCGLHQMPTHGGGSDRLAHIILRRAGARVLLRRRSTTPQYGNYLLPSGMTSAKICSWSQAHGDAWAGRARDFRATCDAGVIRARSARGWV